jgi:hypothetical protein
MQLLGLAAIFWLGRFPASLLWSIGVLGSKGSYWCERYGWQTYLVASMGLLALALVITICTGKVKENRIEVEGNALGLCLFAIWRTQNLVSALLCVLAFLAVLQQTPPDWRGNLLRSIIPSIRF